MVIFYSYVSLPEGNPLYHRLVPQFQNFCVCLRVSRKSRPAKKSTRNGLVVSTPLKNMKVNWDDYSQYMEIHKSHVPNHQPDENEQLDWGLAKTGEPETMSLPLLKSTMWETICWEIADTKEKTLAATIDTPQFGMERILCKVNTV